MQMNEKEFDQIIRSIMENAEEEVPSRVWSSVSSELGIGKKAKVAALNWKRIAGIAAVAAAVLAGIFLFDTTNYQTTNTIPDRVADLSDFVASEAEAPMVLEGPASQATTLISQSTNLEDSPTETVPALPEFPEAESIPDSESALISEFAPDSEFAPETLLAEIAEGADSQAAGSAPVQPEGKSTVSQEGASSVSQGEESFSDPFAQMEIEDAQKKGHRRPAIKIGGDIFTNSNADGLKNSRYGRHGDQTRTITQISKESSYSVPISLGLGISIPLTDRWAIETGLTWSYLERTFTGTYRETGEDGLVEKTVSSDDIRNSIHYAGIPVNISYSFFPGSRTQFYAFAGGSVEKAFTNKFRVPYGENSICFKESVSGVQFSAAIGIGVNFKLTDYLGFYIDPSLRYYFDNGQPTSIRTQQPLMMSLELGFRFNL